MRCERAIYCEFIRRWDIRWTYFATGTFRRDRTTIVGARNRLLDWVGGLAPAIAPTFLIYSIAWHPRRWPRTAHWHCVWASPSESQDPEAWRTLKESWFLSYGIARFYPYDSRRGAAWYLTAYLNKPGSDWGIYERSV